MTPEIYMRRFHGPDSPEGECCAIAAEDLFPCPQVVEPCCHPQPEDPVPCCCKGSMIDALRLLCSAELSDLVDYEAFFFLTGHLAVGSTLAIPVQGTGPADNITAPAASFRRFSPCNSDLLEVSATAFYSSPTAPAVALEEVDQVSLCALKAVAFQLADRGSEAENEAAYRRALRLFRRELGSDAAGCAPCEAHCDGDPCCCSEGLIYELSRRNLSRTATLTAGPLVLREVAVLGSAGSVLVLANETLRRFYLVCVDAVEVLG